MCVEKNGESLHSENTMGIKKQWLEGQLFARSIKRQIDTETLLDLLGIVVYEANRGVALEDAGFSDDTPSVDCLFGYVLDAMDVPCESDAFTREPFEQMFYNDFWLEKKYESLRHVLAAMEVLRDSIAERSTNAETKRASFRIVDSEG